jgi:hypothetical protein
VHQYKKFFKIKSNISDFKGIACDDAIPFFIVYFLPNIYYLVH